MSKGNLFLGFARGKVGDVVFSRQSGEQVARARNRSPKNPQSPLQMLQRVVLKTNSTAYSMLQPICNHSFQGRQEGTENQSRFSELNIAAMRRQLRDVINSGDPEEILQSTEYNFAGKYSSLAQFRSYVISEGTLPVLTYDTGANHGHLNLTGLSAAMTYAQVVDALRLQQGDQLTFVGLTIDDRASAETSEFNGLKYARVILEPSDGDMSKPFLLAGESSTYTVNLPNEKNDGDVKFNIGAGTLDVTFAGTAEVSANTLAGFATIASRLSGGVWARSTQSLELDPNLAQDHNIGYLYDAIYSFLTAQNSSLYLNQAEGF